MKLVSLKLDAKEAKQEGGCAVECEPPKYPYGMCLYMDEVTMKKLGITEMPSVGTEFPIEGVVKVTGTSEREYEDGKRSSLDLQITSIAIGIEEEDTSAMGRAASKLYPKK